MSTSIRMIFVITFVSLLFSAVLVRSDQTTLPRRSFTIGGNVTYDCIDIYKQPGLDHPLLRNHIIQRKPSSSGSEQKNQTNINKTYEKKKGCPKGTVPIMKNIKEFITDSEPLPEKYFHPLSGDSPGTHISGVNSRNGPFQGVEARFNAYNLNIGIDQASYSQIYIGSGVNNEVNYISEGLMFNPSLFGDGRIWSYGFWKGRDGRGCYNTICPGFVQVSQEIPISQPYEIKPGESGWLRDFIHADKKTGNWWITRVMGDAPSVDIGYWPIEIFRLLSIDADMTGVGGVAQASASGLSPPMGNGRFPNEGESAMFTNVEILNAINNRFPIDFLPVEMLLGSPNCYGLKIGKAPIPSRSHRGYFFNYGGPGGNSCGV